LLITVAPKGPEWLSDDLEVRRPSPVPAYRQWPYDALNNATPKQVTGTRGPAGFAKNPIIARFGVLLTLEYLAALHGPRR
jgi:hypothetical protein